MSSAMAGTQGRMAELAAQYQISYYHMITIPVKKKLGNSTVKSRKNMRFPNSI